MNQPVKLLARVAYSTHLPAKVNPNLHGKHIQQKLGVSWSQLSLFLKWDYMYRTESLYISIDGWGFFYINDKFNWKAAKCMVEWKKVVLLENFNVPFFFFVLGRQPPWNRYPSIQIKMEPPQKSIISMMIF